MMVDLKTVYQALTLEEAEQNFEIFKKNGVKSTLLLSDHGETTGWNSIKEWPSCISQTLRYEDRMPVNLGFNTKNI